MDFEDYWWIFVMAGALFFGGVCIVIALKRNRRKRQPPPMSTIQGAYALSPQYNPTYQAHVYPQEPFGWNVTAADQTNDVTVIRTEGIYIVPANLTPYQGPSDVYEKPPPYNPNI